MDRFDVVIVGLGAMGSASAHRLAVRGLRVLGLEQFAPRHDLGSSHGATRMIRQAYFEDPCYVPLLRRTYALWRELERRAGRTLLVETGGMMLGRPDCATVEGSLRSARAHGLPHELLDAAAIRRRFPPFSPGDDVVGVLEPHAGYLLADAALAALHELARGAGATLRFGARAARWESTAGGGVRVSVEDGSGAAATVEATQLVVAAGPWVEGLPVSVERKVLYWFAPVGGVAPFAPGRFVGWCWERDDGMIVYGFPATDGPEGGIKVGIHREAPVDACRPRARVDACEPDTIERTVAPLEIERMREQIAACIPDAGGACLATATCLYTNAPDGHFVIDRDPRHDEVLLVSPCSGHGFKFAPVIGEIVADLVATGTTPHDIAPFRLSAARWAVPPPA